MLLARKSTRPINPLSTTRRQVIPYQIRAQAIAAYQDLTNNGIIQPWQDITANINRTYNYALQPIQVKSQCRSFLNSMASPNPSRQILKFQRQIEAVTGRPCTPQVIMKKEKVEKVRHPRGAKAFPGAIRALEPKKMKIWNVEDEHEEEEIIPQVIKSARNIKREEYSDSENDSSLSDSCVYENDEDYDFDYNTQAGMDTDDIAEFIYNNPDVRLDEQVKLFNDIQVSQAKKIQDKENMSPNVYVGRSKQPLPKEVVASNNIRLCESINTRVHEKQVKQDKQQLVAQGKGKSRCVFEKIAHAKVGTNHRVVYLMAYPKFTRDANGQILPQKRSVWRTYKQLRHCSTYLDMIDNFHAEFTHFGPSPTNEDDDEDVPAPRGRSHTSSPRGKKNKRRSPSPSLRSASPPPNTTSTPLRTTSTPLRNMSDPLRNMSDPLRNMSDPLRNMSDPLRNTSPPLRSASPPPNTTSMSSSFYTSPQFLPAPPPNIPQASVYQGYSPAPSVGYPSTPSLGGFSLPSLASMFPPGSIALANPTPRGQYLSSVESLGSLYGL